MCRLFGLNASPHRVHARFWLLDAPDCMTRQSRRNPDGTGLGYFDPRGVPVLDKAPAAAYRDSAFAREARHVSSTVFVSHVRFATTGGSARENCHPFAMDGRIFAHNGALGDRARLEARLGDAVMSRVRGQTDSERYFALLTQEIRAHGGDIAAGFEAAVRWIAAELPVNSMNCVLATPNELWAFRYPRHDRLFVLERPAGGHCGDEELHYASGTLRVHSAPLADRPSVVVASEPLDESPHWRPLRSGELLRVDRELHVSSRLLIADRPARRMLFPVRSVRGMVRDLALRVSR
jgi:glutamine amidotransferase